MKMIKVACVLALMITSLSAQGFYKKISQYSDKEKASLLREYKYKKIEPDVILNNWFKKTTSSELKKVLIENIQIDFIDKNEWLIVESLKKYSSDVRSVVWLRAYLDKEFCERLNVLKNSNLLYETMGELEKKLVIRLHTHYGSDLLIKNSSLSNSELSKLYRIKRGGSKVEDASSLVYGVLGEEYENSSQTYKNVYKYFGNSAEFLLNKFERGNDFEKGKAINVLLTREFDQNLLYDAFMTDSMYVKSVAYKQLEKNIEDCSIEWIEGLWSKGNDDVKKILSLFFSYYPLESYFKILKKELSKDDIIKRKFELENQIEKLNELKVSLDKKVKVEKDKKKRNQFHHQRRECINKLKIKSDELSKFHESDMRMTYVNALKFFPAQNESNWLLSLLEEQKYKKKLFENATEVLYIWDEAKGVESYVKIYQRDNYRMTSGADFLIKLIGKSKVSSAKNIILGHINNLDKNMYLESATEAAGWLGDKAVINKIKSFNRVQYIEDAGPLVKWVLLRGEGQELPLPDFKNSNNKRVQFMLETF